MTAKNMRHIEPVGHNQFNMWRCITAMAHADGDVTKEEADHLRKIFDRMGLTEDQRKTLESDLENPFDVNEILPQINDPKYRSQIVYFARLLAAKDGTICPDEKQLLEKLHADTIGQIDIDAIRPEIQENINDELIKHDIEMAQNRPELKLSEGRFMFWAIDQIALKMGIDILE